MPYYAGIGSRRTPGDVLDLMAKVAANLRAQSYTLRSGHAPGADQAFELGAAESAEIYLPWPSFESSVSTHLAFVLDEPAEEAYEMASRFHPAWDRCSQGARRLHARNCHQVLGSDLKTPAKFVICWTPDGSLDGNGPNTGGTGQALRIAVAHEIPVFNLALPEHWQLADDWVSDAG